MQTHSPPTTVARICANCGGTFWVALSRLQHGRGKHCSPTCQYAAMKARPKRVLRYKCVGCGQEFSRFPSWSKRKGAGKFCTRACRDEHWVGDKTPLYVHGSGTYKRGPHWYSIRRRIIARDKVCQHCGTDGTLHVHHKIPFCEFADETKANAETNLIALCPPCHRRADADYRRQKVVA